MDLDNRIQRVIGELQSILQDYLSLVSKRLADPREILRIIQGLNISQSSASGFDPYAVLGVDRKASDDEIKRSYLDLMARLHPDKTGRNTSVLAAIVNLAYQQIQKERGVMNDEGRGHRTTTENS
jgi:DnaJ-class molecular chaperone